MIVGDCFKGDLNKTLMWVQHDAFSNNVGLLFQYPRERFLKAVKLVGVDTLLAQKARQVESFDHRVLQWTHDILAAWFRYRVNDHCQLPLWPEGDSYEMELLIRWTRFYNHTVHELTNIYDTFVLSVIRAVCYENTVPGYRAEDVLINILGVHCSVDDWLKEDSLKALFPKAKKPVLSSNRIPLTKNDVCMIVNTYLAKKESRIGSICDHLPKGYSAYNPPKEECWYISCSVDMIGTCLDGPMRLICVSKISGEVVFDQIVNGG